MVLVIARFAATMMEQRVTRGLAQALLLLCCVCTVVQPTNGASLDVYLDTHSHALESCTDTGMDYIWTPGDSMDWHLANGYTAMFITNHQPDQLVEPGKLAMLDSMHANLRVLPGREFSPNNFHLVVLFNPTTYDEIYHTRLAGGMSPNSPNPGSCLDEAAVIDFIKQVHSIGGLAVLAHPHLLDNPCELKPTFEQWMQWGLDYVERITSSIPDVKNMGDEDAAGFGHRVLAGTDGHNRLKTVPGAYTRLRVAPDNFTQASVWEQLVQGSQGNPGAVWVAYDPSRLSGSYWTIVAIVGSLTAMVFGATGAGVCMCVRRARTLAKTATHV